MSVASGSRWVGFPPDRGGFSYAASAVLVAFIEVELGREYPGCRRRERRPRSALVVADWPTYAEETGITRRRIDAITATHRLHVTA